MFVISSWCIHLGGHSRIRYLWRARQALIQIQGCSSCSDQKRVSLKSSTYSTLFLSTDTRSCLHILHQDATPTWTFDKPTQQCHDSRSGYQKVYFSSESLLPIQLKQTHGKANVKQGKNQTRMQHLYLGVAFGAGKHVNWCASGRPNKQTNSCRILVVHCYSWRAQKF